MTKAIAERIPIAAETLPVLVVDDDRALLRTLADILRARGYEPRVASSGREGLELLADGRAPPAIALVDIRLPDMDGMEVVRRLRQRSRLIEVVVLTGHASVESAVDAMREESCDYLVKPVAPARLLDTLARASERWLRRRAEEALRRGEERFRRLIEGISEVIFLLDGRLAIDYASPSVKRVLGIEPGILAGSPFLGLAATQPPPPDFAERLRALAPGRTLDLAARHADGGERLLQLSTSDLLAHPEMPGLVVTARDVTEQRLLERQALQAHRLDSVGRLAGGVAHDFNNILSVILGAGELALADAQLPPEARDRVGEIQAAASRATGLVQQLLQFAKRRPGDARVVSLRNLVHELEPLLRRLVGAGIELAVAVGDAPLHVRVDPSQLEQVVMNLAANARDAMPDGGRLVLEARTLRADAPSRLNHGDLPDGPCVLLAVVDNGTGMPEEVRAHALEPFFTTKETGKGTGLGLSICWGIVKQAGGSVAIESEPGKGTRIEVVLPLAEAPAADTTPVAEAPLPRGRESLLLVEDDPAVRRVLEPMLAWLGYRVTAVAGGEEALALLRARPELAQLVVTDIVMPRMSGMQLAREAREIAPALRLLFVSGYAGKGGVEAPKCAPLLQKPVTFHSLAHAVRAALDRPPENGRPA